MYGSSSTWSRRFFRCFRLLVGSSANIRLGTVSELQCCADIITLRIRALWTDNRGINLLLQSVYAAHVVATSGLLINMNVLNARTSPRRPALCRKSISYLDVPNSIVRPGAQAQFLLWDDYRRLARLDTRYDLPYGHVCPPYSEVPRYSKVRPLPHII